MRGEQLIIEGRYADALVELHALRQTETHERIDLAIGIALLRRGELDRAEPHLHRAREAGYEAEALTALGEIYRRQGDLGRAEDAFDVAHELLRANPDGEQWARCLVGLAAIACARGDYASGRELANQAAEANATPSAHVAAHLVLARCFASVGELGMAERTARTAINLATKLPHELADAYIAYASLIGDARGALDGVALDSPAAMLARAQALLREQGSLTDLERIREAFEQYGRRATDKVSTDQIRPALEQLRHARTTISREAHLLVDVLRRASPDLAASAESTIEQSLHTMSEAEARALTATQAVISERETVRILLDFVGTLNQLVDTKRVLAESCRMAAQLTSADRAIIALTNPAGVLEVRQSLHVAELAARVSSPDLGRRSSPSSPDLLRPTPEQQPRSRPSRPTYSRITPWPEVSGTRSTQEPDPFAETPWQRALDEVVKTRAPTLIADAGASARGDGDLRVGSALVVPLRAGNHIFGALYVDNELTGGLFTSRHLDLLALFAAHVATMLQNSRTAEEVRLAARSRAATLEAISDGVLWLDRAGVVTAINGVAAGILGVAPGTTPRLAAVPALAFLEAALERGEPVDDQFTRIGPHEVMVNARVVRDDEQEIVGTVVTLIGMKRAKSMAQRIAGSPARYSFRDLIGESPSLKGRLRIAESAARSDSNVLILGESGTGKEVVAQAIHNASPRAAGPFVGINCSAIPRELLESELFGYEGGAFTGARRGGQPGKFELAEGGTILLDEIGDMPLEMQAKLLRVLQERRVRRIGGTREVVLDARVIATTHQDLDAAAAQGRFRSDLLFRLKVIEIIVPPLRDRTGDVPLLVEHFMTLFAKRLGKRVRAVAPHVMDALQGYAWPGNIRELENVLESEMSLIDDHQTVLDHVPSPLVRAQAQVLDRISTRTLEDAERQLLVETLARHQGSVSDAARELGIARGTVYNKLTSYGIDPKRFRGRS